MSGVLRENVEFKGVQKFSYPFQSRRDKMPCESTTNEQLVADIRSGINVRQNMQQLWIRNQGIIRKLANKYSSIFSMEFDDLYQEAYFALVEAVNHYNSSKDTSFLSYSILWFRQKMIRYCQNNGCTVQIPVDVSQELHQYNRFINLFFQNNGRNPTDTEIRHYLGINEESLKRIQKAARMTQIGSLDDPVNEDGIPLGELIPDAYDLEEIVLDVLNHEKLQEILWPMVDELPDLQGNVLKLRYQKSATLQATSDALGIPFSRARAIEQDALRALSRPSRRRKLEPYLPETIESRAYRGSVNTFNYTWTSSTESSALKLIGEE